MGRDRTNWLNRHQFEEQGKKEGESTGHMLSRRIGGAVYEHAAAKHQQTLFTGKHGVENAILYIAGNKKTVQGRFRSTTPTFHGHGGGEEGAHHEFGRAGAPKNRKS